MTRAIDLTDEEWDLLKRVRAAEKLWYRPLVNEFGAAGLSLVTKGLVTMNIGKAGGLKSTDIGGKLIADNT